MNNIKTNWVFYVLIGLIFLINTMLWTIQLTSVLHWVQQYYALSGNKVEVLGHYVNAQSWFKLKVLVMLLSFTIIVFISHLSSFMRQVFLSLRYVLSLFYKDFLVLTFFAKCFIVVVIIGFSTVSLLYSSQVFFQLDELNCWLYFVDRGFFVTTSYFPSTNNHVGYNVLSLFWNLFLEPIHAMRATALIASPGTIILLFLVLNKRYTTLMACIGVIFLMSQFPFFWYSIQGRGYALELLCLSMLAYFIVQKDDQRIDFAFVLVSAYALFVISVALIPVGVLFVFYFYKQKNDPHIIQRASVAALAIIVLTCLLYSPILVFSDANLLFFNPAAKHVSYIEAPSVLVNEYFPSIWMFITDTEGLLSVVLFCLFIVSSSWMVYKRKFMILLPVFLVLCLPCILFLCYPVLIFDRTWLWLIVPLSWWFTEVLSFYKESKVVAIVFSAVFFSLLLYSNSMQCYTVLKTTSRRQIQLEELKRAACNAHVRSIRIDDDVLYTYFRYYERECPFSVELGVKQAKKEECVLVPSVQFLENEGEVICENSIGVLYKSN